MAVLTIGSAVTPFEGGQVADGVIFKTITGTGADASTIVAAVVDKRHVIVDGRLSADGGDAVTILSNANVLDTLQFVVESTLTFPKGLETNTNEALNINKVGAIVSVQGWIRYKTITRGENVPEVYTPKKR